MCDPYLYFTIHILSMCPELEYFESIAHWPAHMWSYLIPLTKEIKGRADQPPLQFLLHCESENIQSRRDEGQVVEYK